MSDLAGRPARRMHRVGGGAKSGSHVALLTGATARTRTALAATTIVAWGLVAAFLGRWAITHGIDLQVYRDAGHVMLRGGSAYVTSFTARGLPFTYPPFALFVFAPLSYWSATTVAWAWGVASLVALALALALVVRRAAPASWPRALLAGAAFAGVACLVLEPVRSTLLDGQVNLFLLLAVVADLLAARSPYRGILVGLAASVKLTPLVFIVYFLAAGDRRAALRAILSFGVATGVAWIVLPRDSSTFWLHQAFSPGRRGGSRSAFNQSWWGLVGRLPAGDLARMGVWLTLCAVTICAGAVLARRLVATRRTLEAVLVVAITGLLVSPISWTHHWAWLAIVPVLLVAGAPRHRAVTVALSLLVAVAVISPYGWHLEGPGSVLASFSLALAGALLLATMGVVEWREVVRSRAPGAPTAATAAHGRRAG